MHNYVIFKSNKSCLKKHIQQTVFSETLGSGVLKNEEYVGEYFKFISWNNTALCQYG
jgi:hypothetical protein